MKKQKVSKLKDLLATPMRSDTKVGTIEKKYSIDLGVRSDMKIGSYLSKKGYPSLSRMLKITK